ncbi:hypothetical protein [Streptomyces hirsutus]|uniref:hypothetical protein n=1 Tax=Streptomyces hirsutus TaxID=35620 RepID=UPI0033BDA0F9
MWFATLLREPATGGHLRAPAGPDSADLARPEAQRIGVVSSPPPKSDEAQTPVCGTAAHLVDSKESIDSRPPLALVLNVVGLGATPGVMTWVSQDGSLSSQPGFTPAGLHRAADGGVDAHGPAPAPASGAVGIPARPLHSGHSPGLPPP